MHLPRKHEVRSIPESFHALPRKMPWPGFRWQSCALAILTALLLIGCDYRLASETNADVCALALAPVTAALQEVPITEPRSGACLFRTSESSAMQRRIEIILMTRSSEAPNDLDRVPRMIMAEAEQAYGHPGSNEFGDLAKLAVAFGSNPPEYLDQVLVAGRGVLMEIHIAGENLSRDELVELTRQLWMRVAEYKLPPS